MSHIAHEQETLNISLWRSGLTKRKEVIENIDYLARILMADREVLSNGDIKIKEEEKLGFELYMIFRRYLFSTITAFFRGYYDISLANARVALEASMYAYIFYYDQNLQTQYKDKKYLRQLDQKFSKITEKKSNLGDINDFLEIYELCSARGAHCDYRMIEDTTILLSEKEGLIPSNDLQDDEKGEFDQKLFDILKAFTTSLKIFNLVMNSANQNFAKAFNDDVDVKLKSLFSE